MLSGGGSGGGWGAEGREAAEGRGKWAGEVLSDLGRKQFGVPGPHSPFSEGPRVEAEPQ